jgi:hypothetical protein
MDYAISHAPIGVTYVFRASKFENLSAAPETLRLAKDKEKEAFLSEFTPDDRIFIEMGGATDQIALVALASGCEVFSIPSFQLGNKDATASIITGRSWSMKDEKPRGGETGDKLTARRNRALALVVCADTNDPRLIPFREDEWRILRVKMLYRSFRQDQKAFLIAFQQLLARLRLGYLLEAAEKTLGGENAPTEKRRVKAFNAKMALDTLLKTFSEAERVEFLTKVGIEDKDLTTKVPRERIDDLFEKVTERLMADDVTVSTVALSMKDSKSKIEKTLTSMDVYKKVFEPIPGVGPLIAARIIANIGDIRRFRSQASLTAFAGYHHFEDGTRARRVAGKVSNWSPELKQAVYLWCDQTLKRKDSPWRAKLDKRRAYELYKLLKDRQLKAMGLDMDVEILPEAYAKRTITSVVDMTVADLEFLATHLDGLRKTAGIKGQDDEAPDSEEEPTAKNPALAKLVKGLKMVALQKGMRWLGQQFLKHIFDEWRVAISLHKKPPQITVKKENFPQSDEMSGIRYAVA